MSSLKKSGTAHNAKRRCRPPLRCRQRRSCIGLSGEKELIPAQLLEQLGSAEGDDIAQNH